MKNIEHMMKCRAIFLYSIGALCDDYSVLEDDRLEELLDSFLHDFINIKFDSFNLIYYFKNDDDNNLCIYEEDEWHNLLIKYLNYFIARDNKNIIKMYEEVGNKNINKISELTELFYVYVRALNDMSRKKVRS